MEYEKAYMFQPANDRPAKRRRIEPQGLQASWKQRRLAFDRDWSIPQRAIDTRLHSINASTVDKVWTYMNLALKPDQPNTIRTGIILTGADGATEAGISKKIAEKVRVGKHRRILVPLSSSSGSNLKVLLKTLIQKAISPKFESSDNDLNDDDDELRTTRTKGHKLLNYDLQLLYDHVREHKKEQVIVALEDTEAFDSDLLSEFIELLGCWQDRIPFTCLLNVATSIDSLQQRLSKAAIRVLDGKVFDVAPSSDEVEQVCEALFDSSAPLWIGSSLISTALERQHDYVQSIDSFVKAVKYAYMSAFYANALSVHLNTSTEHEVVAADHFEALRQLGSFRTYSRRLLDNNEVKLLTTYLESDEALRALVSGRITEGRQKLGVMIHVLKVIRLLQQKLPNTQVTPLSSLYVQAMSGKLNGSPPLRSLLLTIRKVPSNIAASVLRALQLYHLDHRDLLVDMQPVLFRLDALIDAQKETSTKPLRSGDDIHNSTLRTTVVAQKVELSKQKSALSEQDKKYTELLVSLSDCLAGFFEETLVNPSDMVFHEIFVYDLKSPYREVFTPRPRHACERALATPHDYLDCDCCGSQQGGENAEATLSATQPATAVLYQLYLESGSLINAGDLWHAFQAVLGDGKEDAETMALFQRALAEMRYLGMMKSTRKRMDHVAKVMWHGL
ncbi:Origin recognition complex subunit 3 [Elasticomyces elasticus]|uniref:Origin recognition complex subunit 3 n=1 Tax=Elasticomyces elasticus TaxID=574655 RepID=A0AAN7W2D7_9PEZI|nr:Origin recognition complex subunit 3 [Elasticomyces elasticus]